MEIPLADKTAERQDVLSPAGPQDLHFAWYIPPFLHELPLNAPDVDTAVERLFTLATTLLPQHPFEEQYKFMLLLGAQVEEMAANDVLSAGLCFLEVDGQPTASTVQAARLPHGSDDEAIVDELLDNLRNGYPRDEITRQQLPCGPAVTRIGVSNIALKNAETGEVRPVPRNIIQAYVPLPGTSEMLAFELGVFTQKGWDQHSEMFAEILRSIEWGTEREVREVQLLTRQVAQSDPGADVGEPVKREFDELAEQLRTALHESTAPPRERLQLSGTTCEDCWTKGLRSACVARCEWQVSSTTAEGERLSLEKAASALTELGWRVRESTAAHLAMQWKKYSAVITSTEAPDSDISVSIVSACERTANTSMADDFG